MTVIERSEPGPTLIHGGKQWVEAESWERLLARLLAADAEVKSLRQQLEGAVEALREIAAMEYRDGIPSALYCDALRRARAALAALDHPGGQ